MPYLVLARKYRPQTFDQVVQQSHITKTLSHAIEADRVAHAILFTGPRGTGKTTIARILAKALNCHKGPIPTPCNQCSSCVEITQGNAVDVFEIDGASNNSVDQIRELRDNIPYMPSRSRYKIYIIDEVHMLSLAAFNALLKTLEEPPSHILFLFATTDPQKIPVTILSRCQRHDLRRIGTTKISDHLNELSTREGFDLPAEVATMIASQAAGSMRDALSLLDQILASSDGEITYEQILNLLGIVSRKIIFDLATALLNGEMAKMLDILADAYNRGYDLSRLYVEILDHFRNLLIVKMGHNVDVLVDLPQQEIALLDQQSAHLSISALSQVFDFLFQEEKTVRLATHKKLAVEMVFFRLLQMPPALSIDELIEKLDLLKSGLSETTPNLVNSENGDVGVHMPDSTFQQKVGAKTKELQVSKLAANERSRLTSEVSRKVIPKKITSVVNHTERSHTEKRQQKTDKDNISQDVAVQDTSTQNKDIWEQILSIVQRDKPSLGSVLVGSRLIQVNRGHYKLEIKGGGYAIRLTQKHLPQLKQWCRQIVGNPVEIELVTDQTSSNEYLDVKKQGALLKKQALSHQTVLDAIEVFGGKVTEIKILSEGE